MDGQADMVAPETPPNWDQEAERELPRSIEAERGLLGAIFVDNTAMEEAQAAGLKPEMFALTAHARIYQAMAKLIGRNQIADPTTLRPYFEADDSLADIGGAGYLAQIAASAISVVNAPEYARIIVDCHLKRGIIRTAEETLRRAFAADIDESADIIAEDMAARLNDVSDNAATMTVRYLGTYIDGVLHDMDAAFRAGGKLPGMSTGLSAIDALTDGLIDGDLTFIAARPAMGKSALATGIARFVAQTYLKERGPVAFPNLEMKAGQQLHRLLSAETGIPMKKLRRGTFQQKDWDAIQAAAERLRDLPILDFAEHNMTVAKIRAECRRQQRKQGLSMVVIDYLQLLTAEDRYRGQRVNEIEEITRQLKLMALDLDVPVICLSQLSRECEKREDKRPMLADLRGSGSIEQDADNVWFVYRDYYYLEKAKPVQRDGEMDDAFFRRMDAWEMRCNTARDQAEIIVTKCRQGETGTARVRFDARRVTFEDRDDADDYRQGDLL